jgi:DNA-binding GntR family transcriptional regulator
MLLRDSIYLAIRRAILTCEFEPGQDLREQILAERYHVSRSPIRDALLRLEQENLVTVLPRQGYLVNPISMPDVEALFALRVIITSACAAGAARADDVAVGTLERFRTSPGADPDEDAFHEYNRAFHFGIAEICGNPRLAAIEYDLAEQSGRLIRITRRKSQTNFMSEAIIEHNEIIDAIQAHDAETASRLASQHVQIGQARIIAALSPSGQEDETSGEPQS